MSWLDKLERRFGNFYIPGLMAGVVGGQAVVWLVVMLRMRGIYNLLTLDRAMVMAGQVWRLISFIFVPQLSSILALVITLYFYYFVGTALENQWGGFRFNVYFLVGMLGAVGAAFLVGSWDNTGILLSLFLAFAWLFPNMQVLLFFILPIKVKWLGWAAAAFWALEVLASHSLLYAAAMVLELLPFWLFFGRELLQTGFGRLDANRRRNNWNNQYRG